MSIIGYRGYRVRDYTASSGGVSVGIEKECRLPDGRTAVIHGIVTGVTSCQYGQGYIISVNTHVHLVEAGHPGEDEWAEMHRDDPMWHHIGTFIMEHEEEWISKA